MTPLLETPPATARPTAPAPGVLAPLHDSLGLALQRLLHGLRELDPSQTAEVLRLQAQLSSTLACLSHYRALMLPLRGEPSGWPGADDAFTLRHLARRMAQTRGEARAQFAALLHHALAALVATESPHWRADEAVAVRSLHAHARRTQGWLVAMDPVACLDWLPLMADALPPQALAMQLVALRPGSSPEAWSRLIERLRAPMGEARWQRLCAELATR